MDFSGQLSAIASATPAGTHLPEVVVYEDDSFQGWSHRTNLDVYEMGGGANDEISSIIVVSGTWEFYEDINFTGRHITLGPGYYGSVEQAALNQGAGPGWNDIISSFKCVAF